MSFNSLKEIVAFVGKASEEYVLVGKDGTKKSLYISEMSSYLVQKIMKSAPNTEKKGDVITVINSTNNISMAEVCAKCTYSDPELTKLVDSGTKNWENLGSRITRPIFEVAMRLSELGDNEEDEEEKKESS